MPLTTDRNDPKLNQVNEDGQNESHIILSEEERKKGFIRPVRTNYIHDVCKTRTHMPKEIAETYATNPSFYGQTFCCECKKYFPVKEFTWTGTDEKVGS